MAREPNMALLMSATGSLAHIKIVPDIFSFAAKHALLKILHTFSRIYCLENNAWLSQNATLQHEALMAL